LSDEQMTKIKVVDLDDFYNSVVDEFFIWNYLVFQNSIGSSNISKFKIWTVQTNSYGNMTKTKVIDLDALYNFVVDIFSFQIIYYPKNLFEFLIFWNSNFK
jgi:hypothetical protein